MPPSSSMASQGCKKNGASGFPQQGHCSRGGSRFSCGPGCRDSGSDCSGLARVLRGRGRAIHSGYRWCAVGQLWVPSDGGLACSFRRSLGFAVAASGRRQCFHARPYCKRGSRSARQCPRTAGLDRASFGCSCPGRQHGWKHFSSPKARYPCKGGPCPAASAHRRLATASAAVCSSCRVSRIGSECGRGCPGLRSRAARAGRDEPACRFQACSV